MKSPDAQHLADRLFELRDQYVTATLRQRAGKAVQRLQYPDAYPNMLVTRVAGIEALSRSLLMHQEARTKEQLRAVYSKFRDRKTQTMVADYCRSKGKEPESYFGERTWELFKLAVQYRNLLIHECTFLAHEKFAPLEGACLEVFKKLVKLSKVRLRGT